MKTYNPQEIEPKWQKYWEENQIFKANDFDKKPKEYVLDMFPYPSGAGLHVGHPEGYTASDIYTRYLAMNGFNVLHPMGWDAFGLPAENYAIKTGTHPEKTTRENINIFREQIKSLGFAYDWSREIDTTDPNYYKWTQWIFLQLFKHGLAYEDTAPINFCPNCKTGLANEEVMNGLCERCDSRVERKTIRQWILKITKYADRLLTGLEKLDWPESIKLMQKNWIGRSEGTNVKFNIKNTKTFVDVYTTRVDTIFSGTFLILAPEHKMIQELKSSITNINEVDDYISSAISKPDLERAELSRDKSGVELKGIKAINPANNEEISVWISDFVLLQYGTGAVFADAHDKRDFEMAKKYKIKLKVSIRPESDAKWEKVKNLKECYEQDGILVNSAQFNGLSSSEAREKITQWLTQKQLGEKAVSYKLRDWIFSRQRYWGEPIPIIHCKGCGAVAVPDDELPVKLPKVENYEPSGTGDSPLVNIADWVNTTCPKCRGPAKRETNTMPQWAGSCWYYIAFALNQKLALSPSASGVTQKGLVTGSKIKNQRTKNIFTENKNILDYWLPVDLYVGGAEHAVLHLLYSRFWHKFLYDIGAVSSDEPFKKLKNQGMILAEDGRKMSKSLGNVINPDDIVKKYGADALRLYEMFMGPFEMVKRWDAKNIEGVSRFLKKVYLIAQSNDFAKESDEGLINRTIKKVTDDIERFRFNTAISQLMIMANELTEKEPSKQEIEVLAMLLSPFAPHLSEQIWQELGHSQSIIKEKWPTYDKAKIQGTTVTIVIQVNGKKKAIIECSRGLEKEQLVEKIAQIDKISKEIEKGIKKTIYVRDKVLNIIKK